jgi:hypothetical protein
MITDPAAAGGLRLADDLPEPTPQHSECVIELRAFSINYGETILIKQRPEGWRPGQKVPASSPTWSGKAGPSGSPRLPTRSPPCRTP